MILLLNNCLNIIFYHVFSLILFHFHYSEIINSPSITVEQN